MTRQTRTVLLIKQKSQEEGYTLMTTLIPADATSVETQLNDNLVGLNLLNTPDNSIITYTIADDTSLLTNRESFLNHASGLALFSYFDADITADSITIGDGYFKDKTYRQQKTACLMPFNNKYVYHKVQSGYTYNPYLENNSITILSGIASGFSTSAYLKYTNKINITESADFIFKFKSTDTSSHNVIVGNYNSDERYFAVRSTGNFAFYNSGWTESSVPCVLNTDYFVRCIVDKTNTKTTLYVIEAGDYTYETLPSLENWTECCSIDYVLFDNNYVAFGYNSATTSEYLKGSIDLTNSKILIDNVIAWEYPQSIPSTNNLNGCLLYEDTGAEKTTNVYTLFIDGEQYIVLSDTAPSITGATYKLVREVTIPAHDRYSYSQTEVEYEHYNVSLQGSGATYDTTTRIYTGSADGYLALNETLPSEKTNIDMEFKCNFTDISSNSAVIGSGSNQWFIGVRNGKFGGWTSSGWESSKSVEVNKDYYIRIIRNANNFYLYVKEDDDYELVYTGSYDFSQTSWVIGANAGYGGENMKGSIYVGSSHIIIDDVYYLGNETVVTPTWTKL